MARVKIEVGGDSTGFHKTMSGVENRITGLKSKMSGFNLGGSLASIAGGIGIASLVRGAMDFARSIEIASERMGTTVQRTQQLRTVAYLAKKELGDFETIFAKVNTFGNAALAPGSKESNIAKKFGITQEDLTGQKSLTNEQLVGKIFKSSLNMDPSVGQNLLKMVFGKGSSWITPEVRQNYLNKEIKPTVSSEDINKMLELRDAFEDLADTVRIGLIPVFNKLIEWVLNLVGSYIQGTKKMDSLDLAANSSYMSRHGGQGSKLSAVAQTAIQTNYQMMIAGISANPYTSPDEKKSKIDAHARATLTMIYDKQAADDAFKNYTPSKPGGLATIFDDMIAKRKERAAERAARDAARGTGHPDREAPPTKDSTVKAAKGVLDNELKGGKNDFLKIGGLMGIDSNYRLQRVAEKTNQILGDIYKLMLQEQNSDSNPEPDPE